MFGIGSTELLVILLVGLIVLGPKSLANVSRTIGKWVGEFRRVSTDFQRTLNAEAAAEEQKEKMAQMKDEDRVQAEKEASDDKARAERLAKLKEEGISRVKAQREAKEEAKEGDKAKEADSPSLTPPPDSPLARAIAKTQAEAGANASQDPTPKSA